MPDPSQDEVLALLSVLHDAERAVMDAISENDGEAFGKAVIAYRKAKKGIKVALLETTTIGLPGDEHREARKQLQKLKLGQPLRLEAAVKGTQLEGVFRDELTEEDIEALESDAFYSWFSGWDYVLGMYEAATVVAAVGKLPDKLNEFLDQARHCFVFQMYLAVFALCRTALEVAVTQHVRKQELDDPNSENREWVEQQVRWPSSRWNAIDQYDLGLDDMITMLTVLPAYRALRGTLHSVRDRANDVVHARRGASKQGAADVMKQTFQAIHDLYEVT